MTTDRQTGRQVDLLLRTYRQTDIQTFYLLILRTDATIICMLNMKNIHTDYKICQLLILEAIKTVHLYDNQ